MQDDNNVERAKRSISSIEYFLALNMLKGIGVKKKRLIIDYFGGSIADLFHKVNIHDIKHLFFIDESKASNFIETKDKLLEDAKKELAKSRELGISIISIYSKEYPMILKDIYDPPIVLYYKGTLLVDNVFGIIAIVGGRKASTNGIRNSYDLAFEMGELGIIVVSGFARGIDSAAHKGCITGGGKTFAVLGSGVDLIYPYENKKLSEKIIENDGCIISEYPLGTPPIGYHFPVRNRIIAGLSIGVVIVEAGEKSGALHTARYASEFGREVYAFPGTAGSAYYKGNHALIKDGAHLIEDANNLIEDLKLSVDLRALKKGKAIDNKVKGYNRDYIKTTYDNDIENKVLSFPKEKEEEEYQNINEKDSKNVVAKAEREAILNKIKEFDEETKRVFACLGFIDKKKTFDDIVEETSLSVGNVIAILNLLFLDGLCLKEGSYYYRDIILDK